MNSLSKKQQEWLKNTAIFYYQIFSKEYNDEFLAELLKGGGGNSALCGSWYKLGSKFAKSRISGKALEKLKKMKFPLEVNGDVVTIKSKDINNNKSLFSNDAKTIEARKAEGKIFHFDHNPSNKHLLNLMNEKVKVVVASGLPEDDQIDLLSDFIYNLQTKDLITIEQDDVITKADKKRKTALSKDVRDKMLNDKWYWINWE